MRLLWVLLLWCQAVEDMCSAGAARQHAGWRDWYSVLRCWPAAKQDPVLLCPVSLHMQVSEGIDFSDKAGRGVVITGGVWAPGPELRVEDDLLALFELRCSQRVHLSFTAVTASVVADFDCLLQGCPSLPRTTRTSSCSGSCWTRRRARGRGASAGARGSRASSGEAHKLVGLAIV